MKKFFSILAVLLFMSNISFASSFNQDCQEYGFSAAAAEEAFYGDTYGFVEYIVVALEYQELCEEAGGDLDDPATFI